MRRSVILLITLVIFLSAIQFGCSGNPSSPGIKDETELTRENQVDFPDHVCLGTGSLIFDRETGEVEILPSRIGDLHINLLLIYDNSPAFQIVTVPSESDLATGLLALDITLAHPIPAKPELTFFDLKFILMTPGKLAIGALVLAGTADTRIENADGYTRWWNPTEFTTPGALGYIEGAIANAPAIELNATVNPFKYFATALSYDDPMGVVINEPMDSDNGRGVLRTNSYCTRRMYVRFPVIPELTIRIGYAIDCAWDLPDPNPPVEIPDDFPIAANQPEAYYVSMQPSLNTLFYDTESSIGGGELVLEVDVYDWQGQYSGNIQSQVNVVKLYSPYLWTGAVIANFESQTTYKATYEADMTGLLTIESAGDVIILARVESSDGSLYKQANAAAPMEVLSAYQVLNLNIPELDCTPDDNNAFSEAEFIGFGDYVSDKICEPDDSGDYYYFNITPGHKLTGELKIQATGTVSLRLYDSSEQYITETTCLAGTASLNLDEIFLMPEVNYIMATTCSSDVVFYELEFDVLPVNITPPIPPMEITPPGLFAKGEEIWRTQTHAILTGEWGYWVYAINQYTYEPTLVSSDLGYQPRKGEIFGSRLFLINNGSPFSGAIDMIDFSNPASPVYYESVIEEPVSFVGITIGPEYMYLGTPGIIGTDVMIYNWASSPTAPVKIAEIPNANSPKKLEIIYTGTHDYLVVGGNNKILAFDVTDPLVISQVGTYNRPVGVFTDMHTSFLNVLFTIYNTALNQGTLYILEYTGSGLDEVGVFALAGDVNQLETWSQNAFISDGLSGFSIVDYSNLLDIQLDSTTFIDAYCEELSILGDVLCAIPEDSGMYIYNVGNTVNPSFKAKLPVVNNPREAIVHGNYLLVYDSVGFFSMLKIVDISDPSNAYLADEYYPGDWIRAMDIEGDTMVICKSYGFSLINAADPLSLSELSTGSYSNIPLAASIHNDTLYIAYNAAKLLIYDITNPSSPHYESNYTVENIVTSFAYNGTYMYTGTETGIDVYSIADPLSPTFLMHYTTADEIKEITIQGKYLYMVTPTRLEIANLSSPSSPTFTGSVIVDPVLELTELVVDSQYAYVQGQSSGPIAINLYPPSNPTVVGTLYDQYFISPFPLNSDILLSDGVLYDMNQYTGIRMHELY